MMKKTSSQYGPSEGDEWGQLLFFATYLQSPGAGVLIFSIPLLL